MAAVPGLAAVASAVAALVVAALAVVSAGAEVASAVVVHLEAGNILLYGQIHQIQYGRKGTHQNGGRTARKVYIR